jgi:hypothetical protein
MSPKEPPRSDIDENQAPYVPTEATTVCYMCPSTACDGFYYVGPAELGRELTCAKCGLVFTIGRSPKAQSIYNSHRVNADVWIWVRAVLVALLAITVASIWNPTWWKVGDWFSRGERYRERTAIAVLFVGAVLVWSLGSLWRSKSK